MYPDCISEEDLGSQDTSLCPPPGDINQDETVDIVDVIFVIQIILEIYLPNLVEELSADYNYDGSIDIVDVVMMVNLILSN